MKYSKVFYEPRVLEYQLGKELKEKFIDLEWVEIENHNSIKELQNSNNSEFVRMKNYLIVGIRKTHKYVENNKISDFLVPYTSSGCSAMCLYCYLVCNYNKCSYLRLFVNRELMLDKIIKRAEQADRDLVFEIGSNSDLVLENTITSNLNWTIENFARAKKGMLTLPTKFHYVDSLLPLPHNGKVIIRMSVNPDEVIKKVELRTSDLNSRIDALNKLAEADYKIGLLIAPIVLVDDWENKYINLLDKLADSLSQKTKNNIFIEMIFMTYSYIHKAINNDAFPNAIELYDKKLMGSRGYGKYCYKPAVRHQAEFFLVNEVEKRFGKGVIRYVV